MTATKSEKEIESLVHANLPHLPLYYNYSKNGAYGA